MKSRHWIGFYFIVDFIVTTVVISVVVSFFVSAIRESRKSVEVAAASAEIMGLYRAILSAYYALNGEWPPSSEEFQKMFPETSQTAALHMAANVRIAGGAVTFDLRRQLSGRTLSLHPAVPAQDVFGPVKWVAGGKSHSQDWTMVGEDRTTVEDKYIAKTLKR